jgi:hypothetical protein
MTAVGLKVSNRDKCYTLQSGLDFATFVPHARSAVQPLSNKVLNSKSLQCMECTCVARKSSFLGLALHLIALRRLKRMEEPSEAFTVSGPGKDRLRQKSRSVGNVPRQPRQKSVRSLETGKNLTSSASSTKPKPPDSLRPCASAPWLAKILPPKSIWAKKH